jgi:hypothetical protein
MTDVQDREHDDLAALYRGQPAAAFQCFGAGPEQRVGDPVAELPRVSLDPIRTAMEQERARAFLERLGGQ